MQSRNYREFIQKRECNFLNYHLPVGLIAQLVLPRFSVNYGFEYGFKPQPESLFNI